MEMRADASQDDKDTVNKMEAEGVKVTMASQELIAEMREVLEPVAKDIKATFDPEFMGMLEADIAK